MKKRSGKKLRDTAFSLMTAFAMVAMPVGGMAQEAGDDTSDYMGLGKQHRVYDRVKENCDKGLKAACQDLERLTALRDAAEKDCLNLRMAIYELTAWRRFNYSREEAHDHVAEWLAHNQISAPYADQFLHVWVDRIWDAHSPEQVTNNNYLSAYWDKVSPGLIVEWAMDECRIKYPLMKNGAIGGRLYRPRTP